MSDTRQVNIVSAEFKADPFPLLGRMPELRLKVSPDSLRWRPSMILRGLDALPVLF